MIRRPPRSTLFSLHDALPISPSGAYTKPVYLKELLTCFEGHPKTKFLWCHAGVSRRIVVKDLPGDRKSTRLNSSHANISYAVFCLKKKKKCTSIFVQKMFRLL